MTTTINASTSSGLVQTADTSGIIKLQSNGVTTNALAWVNFVGSSGSVVSGYNVSSVTRNGTGDYTLNFTSALSDANYTIATCPQIATAASATRVLGLYATATDGSTGVTKTTSAVRMLCQISTNGATQDMVFNGVAIFGN